MHHAHNAVGTIVVLLTLISCFEVYYKFDWVQSTSAHGILGLICMLCSAVVGASGFACVCVMHESKSQRWTKVERVTVVARIHRYAGYVMLFFGNLITSGGLVTYVFGISGGDALAFFFSEVHAF